MRHNNLVFFTPLFYLRHKFLLHTSVLVPILLRQRGDNWHALPEQSQSWYGDHSLCEVGEVVETAGSHHSGGEVDHRGGDEFVWSLVVVDALFFEQSGSKASLEGNDGVSFKD